MPDTKTKTRTLREKNLYKCRGYTFDLSKRTYIMGILNITPDSFSDGGRFFSPAQAVKQALLMQEQGADMIDIGAESTRPGAMPIEDREQISRIEPVLKKLAGRIKIPISIDTSSSVVARRCLELGVNMINDVCALSKDKNLAKVIAEYKAGVILMHMQKKPVNMQDAPKYKDLIGQIKDFLNKAKQQAVKQGIDPQSIMVDPGIGFGKTTIHNLRIINELDKFKTLNCGILIGTSRKSFIGNVLDLPVNEREFGTAASIALAIAKGANVVRVHSVKQMKQAAAVSDAVIKQG